MRDVPVNHKKKLLLIPVCIIMALTITGVSACIFYDGASPSATTEITTYLVDSPASEARLVPSGYGKDDNHESLRYIFAVRTDPLPTNRYRLSVEVLDILIDGLSDDIASLICIDVDAPSIIETGLELVTVTITLTEPSDQDQYASIVGKTLSFRLDIKLGKLVR